MCVWLPAWGRITAGTLWHALFGDVQESSSGLTQTLSGFLLYLTSRKGNAQRVKCTPWYLSLFCSPHGQPCAGTHQPELSFLLDQSSTSSYTYTSTMFKPSPHGLQDLGCFSLLRKLVVPRFVTAAASLQSCPLLCEAPWGVVPTWMGVCRAGWGRAALC